MNKIKICHIVSALKSGGAESMIYNYSKELSSEDYDFYLLHQYSAVEKNIIELENIGFKIEEITPKKKNILKNYRETKKFFINNDIDIVHAHMTLANFVPLYAAKKAGIKVRICHSHETGSTTKNFIKVFFEFLLKKICAKYATVLVACGMDAGKYMYGKKKFLIFNNAIDLDKFKYNEKIRKEKRKELNIDEETVVIGHIGRFIEVKNHDFIIKIARELLKTNQNYKIILIGNGEMENEIRKEIIKFHLEKSISMIGIVDNPYDFYNIFDVFVLPSKREGLPIVALEAQASGLKCIFSNTIDQSTSIVNENCQFLELNVVKWVKVLKRITSSYDRNKKIKNNFAIRNLDIKVEYKKLDKLYKENYYE